MKYFFLKIGVSEEHFSFLHVSFTWRKVNIISCLFVLLHSFYHGMVSRGGSLGSHTKVLPPTWTFTVTKLRFLIPICLNFCFNFPLVPELGYRNEGLTIYCLPSNFKGGIKVYFYIFIALFLVFLNKTNHFHKEYLNVF